MVATPTPVRRLWCSILCVFLVFWVVDSSITSVWTNQEDGTASSTRRPLHWLQQHFGSLFGPATRDTPKRRKKSSGGSTTHQADVSGVSPSRRRLLYQDAWQRHVPQSWTVNGNLTVAAFDMFLRPSSNTFPPFPPSMRESTLQRIRHMFYHAYNGYYWNAWPDGELLPGSCEGHNFSLVRLPALTAIDALDTLWVLGNNTELVRIVERLRQLESSHGSSLWNINQNISVFETTIRVLGGLLSGHQILEEEFHIWQHDIWDPVSGLVLDGQSVHPDENEEGSCPAVPPVSCEESWPACWAADLQTSSCTASNSSRRSATAALYQYDGLLLRMATDIANRMLPAFATPTGIPYGTVHLQSGVPEGETPIASLAGGGTLVLEWELLSRLTGKAIYGQVARRAARGLWMRRSDKNLVGKHIDTKTGHWVESLSGIGSNSDSFIEYLVKYAFVFLDGAREDEDFRVMWPAIYQGVFEYLRHGDWYADTDYKIPTTGRAVLESLMAFYPGLQVWLGELAPAARSLNSFFLVREHLGFLPERFSYKQWRAEGARYPLRPELFESNYFLHRATQAIAATSPFSNRSDNSGWLWPAAWSVDKLSRLQTSCGFASLHLVDPDTTGSIGDSMGEWQAENDMPSFFLSETLKYLYLTFDEDNPMHQDDDRQWMFTTEAHPIHLPSDNEFQEDIIRLDVILMHRLQGSRSPTKSIGKVVPDIWSPETNFRVFLSQLFPTELQMKREQINQPKDSFFFSDRSVLEPTVETDLVEHDSWEEIEKLQNLAHLGFAAQGIGPGFSLRPACPNFHASELLWIHALNGDSLDFVDDFVTVKDGRGRPNMDMRPAYGASEALGYFGMGYNPSQRGELEGCSIRGVTSQQGGKKTRTPEEVPDDVVEIESELGTFRIKAFKDGRGFTVDRMDDGYSLTASFLHGFDITDKDLTYIMLVSEPRGAGSSGRHVHVADFAGNAFSCEVLLMGVSHEEGDAAVDELVRVPCTPAMFGPAHLTNLIEYAGAELTASIHTPPLSDRIGCDPPPDTHNVRGSISIDALRSLDVRSAQMCLNANIQLVDRGICSFMTKAVNQKRDRQADGVIVINNQDERFVMASDPDVSVLDCDQTPLAVMVTKSDGKLLLAAMKEFGDVSTQILGKISLEAQLAPEELETIAEQGSSVRFPVLHATESLIQIYMEGYWGIQAVAVDGSWNIQLVRHNLG